jgi:uncharacterized RDD family membrane protein YckC
MANGHSAEESQEEAEYATGTSRLLAGIVDMVFMGTIATLVFLLIGIPPFTLPILIFLFGFMTVFGIIHLLLSAVFEASRQRTIGKYIIGIEVFSLTGEPVTGGQAFSRNISKIHFIGYLIDIAGGMGKQPTQKLSDSVVNTVLIKSRATIIRRPRKRDFGRAADDFSRAYRELEGLSEEERRRKIDEWIARGYLPGDENLPPEEQKRRLMEFLRQEGIPVGKEEQRQKMMDILRHGRCSRCNSPFRILEKGDTSFSGLWNSHCTWCNKAVFEDDFKGRIEPGFKPDSGGYGGLRSRGFMDWERESYRDWETKRDGRGGVEPGFRKGEDTGATQPGFRVERKRGTEPGFKP